MIFWAMIDVVRFRIMKAVSIEMELIIFYINREAWNLCGKINLQKQIQSL